MPVGPAAAYAGTIEAGKQAIEYQRAGYMPTYQLETSLGAQRLAGSYVNPVYEAGMTRAAQMQGVLNQERTLAGWGDKLTFGASSLIYDTLRGQDFQRQVEFEQARANAAPNALELAARTGHRSDFYNNAANLNFKMGVEQSLRPYGRLATQEVDRTDDGIYTSMLREFKEPGTLSAVSTITALGGDPAMREIRQAIRNGVPLRNLYKQASQAYAARGDMAAITAQYPWFKADGNESGYDDALRNASRVVDVRDDLEQLSLTGQITQSGFQQQRSTGAGYKTLNNTLSTLQQTLKPQVEKLQGLRDIAPNETERLRYQSQISALQAQITAIPGQKAGIEFGQRSQSLQAQSSLVAGMKWRFLEPIETSRLR